MTHPGNVKPLRQAALILTSLILAGPATAPAQSFKLDQLKVDPGRAIQDNSPAGPGIALEGRVLPRDGEPFSGTGQFKFVLYRRDPNGALRQLWNSARGLAGGAVGEPGTSIGVPVRAGRYALTLGDGSLTPRLPGLSSPVPLPTPYVRVWFRDPDGAFRIVGPDLPVDAVPLAREAALASDADHLGGQSPDYYLNRANHRGAEPRVEYVHVFHAARVPPMIGCGQLKVELTVDAPDDGVLVIIGHANITGIVRGGGGNCGGSTQTAAVCPPSFPDAPPAPGSPPPPPGTSSPGGSLPALNPPQAPASPGGKMPPGPSLRGIDSTRRSVQLPCIVTELYPPPTGSRVDSMGGRGGLYLFRRDITPVEMQMLSRTGIEFMSDVLIGRRMDVSATIAVQRGRVRIEMVGYNSSDGGFGEHNLTAMFFPQRP